MNVSEPGDQSLVLNMHKRLGLTDYSEECVHKEDTCIGKHLGSAAIFCVECKIVAVDDVVGSLRKHNSMQENASP